MNDKPYKLTVACGDVLYDTFFEHAPEAYGTVKEGFRLGFFYHCGNLCTTYLPVSTITQVKLTRNEEV